MKKRLLRGMALVVMLTVIGVFLPAPVYASQSVTIQPSDEDTHVMEKDADLYDLILATRVLITQSSTTALDAMLFNKDVVVIDLLLPVKDPMSYVKSGAALGVYREDELLDTLHKIFNDESTQRELQRNRKKFTAEYTYKFDGRSASRVIELIGKMLKQRGS